MSDEHTLRKLLARVHERLNSSANVDPGKRASLQKVMQDIDQRLQARQGESTSGHVSRLEALAVQFEAEHPALAQLLRQLGALLGQAGI